MNPLSISDNLPDIETVNEEGLSDTHIGSLQLLPILVYSLFILLHFQVFAIGLFNPQRLFVSLKYFGSFFRPRYLAFCCTIPFDMPRRLAISALGVSGYKARSNFLSNPLSMS